MEHDGLPVSGYRAQSNTNVELVNDNKEIEEQVLRMMDDFSENPNVDKRWLAIARTQIEQVLRMMDDFLENPNVDKRWLAIARTQIEQGFMALNRSIFKPERVDLPDLDDEPNVELIASVAHEANRGLCLAFGDHSQVAWSDAEKWQKDSAVTGVKFRIENPDATPEDQHDAWMKHKFDDGWTYGTVKNEETKTHPCMVPYHQLPAEQRAKDHVFGAIVSSLI